MSGEQRVQQCSGLASLADLADRCDIYSCSSVMVRKEILNEYMLAFNSEFVPCDDYAMWILIAIHSRIVFIHRPLVKYRLHNGNVSADSYVMHLALTRLYPAMINAVSISDIAKWRKKIIICRMRRSLGWAWRTCAIYWFRKKDFVVSRSFIHSAINAFPWHQKTWIWYLRILCR